MARKGRKSGVGPKAAGDGRIRPPSGLGLGLSAGRHGKRRWVAYVIGSFFVLVLLFALAWGRDGPIGAVIGN